MRHGGGRVVLVAAAMAVTAGSAPAQEPQRPVGEVQATPWGQVLDFGPDGGWRTRARQVAALRTQLRAAGDYTRLNAALSAGAAAPGAAAVAGEFRVPAIAFRFQDVGTAASFDTSIYRGLLFAATPPAPLPYSLRSFYAETSNGLLDYLGEVAGWVTLDGTETSYVGAAGSCPDNPYDTGNCNGIWSSAAFTQLRAGLREALAKVDAAVDFGQFDGDGNGVVDFVLFLHSERDGACLSATNNHIWAHRSSGLGYLTDDGVTVSDYIIQSGVGGSSGCDSTKVMAIGTAAHESGHAFGLPDLYDTSQLGEGIGRWGLMGSGNWATPQSPAHMMAWSRDRLGWVTVVPLTAGGTYTVGPSAVSDTAFHVLAGEPNPRDEYFLFSNRQGVLSDSAMVRVQCGESGLPFPVGCGGGLAVWHVDGIKSLQGGGVNAGTPQGVKLVQADGLGQLQGGATNRGDAGDVYPGTTGNTALGYATMPGAVRNADGGFAGFIVDSIRQVQPGGEMAFRLRFGQPLLIAVTGAGSVGSTPPVSNDTVLTPGTVVTLTAVPDAGAVFDGWAGDTLDTADTLRLVMDRGWSVRADFVPPLVASFGTPAAGVMGASYALVPTVTGGRGTYAWSLGAGRLPAGLRLGGNGAVTGIPEESGQFPVTVRVGSGPQTLDLALVLSVTTPQLVTASVLRTLVGTGGTLTDDERRYLDLIGNRNGGFDVGDFLAFVRQAGGAVSREGMAELLGKGGAR